MELLYEIIGSIPEVLCKNGVLQNFSKFTDKHKKKSSGDVLSKDVLKKGFFRSSRPEVFYKKGS